MNGWVGVHLFFVISGFCIFERLAIAHARGESALAFSVDRARRIFPTYWSVVLLCLAIALLAMPFNGTPLHTNVSPSVTSWLANLSLVHTFTGHEAFIIVTWTLSCEVAFYLAAACLLALSRPPAGLDRAFVFGVLLCAPSALARLEGRQWVALALWPEFFAGACVSLARRAGLVANRRFHAVSVTMLGVLAALTVLRVGGFDHTGRRWAIAFAWAMFLLAPFDRKLVSWRVVRVLGWVGALSYSLYLLHVPLLSRFMNLAGRHTSPQGAVFAGCWLGAIALTILGGWICWRCIEQPLERGRSAASKRAAMGAAGSRHIRHP